jgi:hypothetical protein
MGKKIHKIEKVELVKVEKNYSAGSKVKYFYNLYLQDIEEGLLLVVDSPLSNELQNKKIKFNLNNENIITEFELN